MKPGIYPKMSFEQYLSLPAFSASLCSTLLDRCPAAAWADSYLNPNRTSHHSDATDLGTIAHGILLEGSMEGVSVIDPYDHPAEKGGGIPLGWTNKSIRAARDAARAEGKIPVLKSDMGGINAMVASGRRFIETLREQEPAVWEAFQPDGGDSELTALWDDHGTLCRMRPDRISKDRRIIIDLKTTARSAEPASWGRSQMIGMGYYLSAALYRRGAESVWNTAPDYLFLVIESEAPYLCSLVGVDPAGFALGQAKIETALSLWSACIETDRWPGYPARAVYPEIPAWEQARWQEREQQEISEHGIEYDPQKLWGGV